MTTVPITIPQILETRAQAAPDSAPLRVEDRVLTYREWDLASRSIAHGILRSGGAPGMRFALLFDGLDWLAYAVAYLGVLRCGGTAIHLNAHLPEAEMQRRLDECGVSWIIRSSFLFIPLRFKGRNTTVGELSIGDTSPVPIAVPPETIADIRYTSGTTGPAKAYLVSHANLTFGRTLEGMTELSRSTVMLAPMTLGSSTGATVLTIGVTSPAKLILCSPADIERMGELIQRERVDSLLITPHIAGQIVEARLGDRYDLSSIRLLASASELLPPPCARALLSMVPGAILQIACAQSEASPALITHTFSPDRPFSVGKPNPITELRVVGQEGREVPAGEVGEVWLRTLAPKRLFLNLPEVNARLLDDGWYRTGDLGKINAHGELEFFDRLVDAVLRHGQLLSSVAMEAILLEHPAVREAAVVTGPQGDGAQEVVAFVVLRDPGALSYVRDHFAKHLPAEYCPDRFMAIGALPRTHNGKVLKRLLRLEIGGRDTLQIPGSEPQPSA